MKDDIFKRILSVREENKGIKNIKKEKEDFFIKPGAMYTNGIKVDFSDSNDINKWIEYHNVIRKKSKKVYPFSCWRAAKAIFKW